MNEAVLSIDRLSKSYRDFKAVDSVSLAVAKGEIFALLGPNGAGKTTTIKMLMGMLAPTTGGASICGFSCFSQREDAMRHVGYLPDDPVFWDYLKGREILRFVGEMHGMSGRTITSRGDPLIARFELADALDEFAVNYSKGMKKKLALACALLHDPELLILDEPTYGLDPYATRALHDILRDEADRGRTVFFSTHLLDQAEKLAHRVGILQRGRLVAEGTLESLRGKIESGDASLEEIFFAVTGDAPSQSEPAPTAAPQDPA
jgi:ABC-2 type transport system ATP-binding protein